MGEKIILDKELLKAIGADTRVSILKSLADHQKTQSDLAKELDLSPPTVLEHLNHLVSAGLVEKLEEGRKWKYYVLTKKGKNLMSSSKKGMEINVLILLTVIAVFVGAAILSNPFLSHPLADDLSGPNLEGGESQAVEGMSKYTSDSLDNSLPGESAVPDEDFSLETEEPDTGSTAMITCNQTNLTNSSG